MISKETFFWTIQWFYSVVNDLVSPNPHSLHKVIWRNRYEKSLKAEDDSLQLLPDHIQIPNDIPTSVSVTKLNIFFLVFFQVEILQFRDRKYSSQMLTVEAAWTLWWPSFCVCIWVPWKRMLWSTINFCHKHRKENTDTYANICHCS